MLRKSSQKASSRRQIQIKEVKDNVLVLPNNEYRVILETSSINFELKSDTEQDVIIDTFQNFLNALPCNLQFVIRIRELDIDQYLETISKTLKNEKEKIYQDQIKNYSAFIKDLVLGNKILTRRFYIVIPYKHTGKDDFELIKEQLVLRENIVAKGLEKIGMKTRELDTFEILDLFYRFYNPAKAKTQELTHESIQILTNTIYG